MRMALILLSLVMARICLEQGEMIKITTRGSLDAPNARGVDLRAARPNDGKHQNLISDSFF